MSQPTFISLFSGVGGLDEGFEKAGWKCVADVEIDKAAAGVRKHRKPDIPIYCDITKVEPEDLPDADAILYGFPCQDVSVAGHRKGMHEGTRTGLLYHAIRLIHGKRDRGLRFALAENVFGLLSADDALALPRVLRELADVGANGSGWSVLDSQHVGWRSSGERIRAVPQRRRRIFILSTFGDIGVESIEKVFAFTSRVSGNPRQNEKAREARQPAENTETSAGERIPSVGVDVYNGQETGETAATVTSATGISNATGPKVMGVDFYNNSLNDETSQTLSSAASDKNHTGGVLTFRRADERLGGELKNHEVSPTLTAECKSGDTELNVVQEKAISIQGSMIGREEKNGPQGNGVNEDVCFTLTSADQHGVVHPIQNATRGKDQNGLGVGDEVDPMYTLDNASQHAVLAFEPRSQDGVPRVTGDADEVVSPTLNTMSGGQRQPAVVEKKDAIAWSERGRDGTAVPEVEKEDVMPALRTAPQSQVGVCSLIADTTPKGTKDVSMALRATKEMLTSTAEYTIRRLTPKECERLQGFDDDHTLLRHKLLLDGNEWKTELIDGEPAIEKQADSPRYKQMGNAVSVTVARWIAEGMLKELKNGQERNKQE